MKYLNIKYVPMITGVIMGPNQTQTYRVGFHLVGKIDTNYMIQITGAITGKQ